MYFLNVKFQEKIFTTKKVIKLWNFGNFGIPEIIPKSLVTLRFSKISLHELKGSCKCFQMRYWPHFYVDPTHSNTYFLKVGKWPVFMQATVASFMVIYGSLMAVQIPALRKAGKRFYDAKCRGKYFSLFIPPKFAGIVLKNWPSW